MATEQQTNTNESYYDIHTNSVDTENGVLQQWVQQPCDSSPEITGTEATYREKFKGNYAAGRLLADATGIDLTAFHAKLGNYNSYYGEPPCPSINNLSCHWVVYSVRVEELEAGDHCNLYVDYVPSESYENPGSGTTVWDPGEDVWNLTWQSYTLSPFNFCQGDAKAHLIPTEGIDSVTPDWTQPASRLAIQNAINAGNIELKTGNGSNYEMITYAPDPVNNPEQKYYLDPANTVIYKKYTLQRNCLWHYPVLTHQRVGRTYNDAYTGAITKIDHIIDASGSELSGCPYSLDLGISGQHWVWVKSGHDMTQTKSYDQTLHKWKTTFTMKETYMGYPPEVDQNFYGDGTFTHTLDGILSGRWQVEKI